jgi:hypothetical protein
MQIRDADDVAFNLPTDIVPASSIEDNSNDEISPAAESTDLFESGHEAVEDSDDAHVVVIKKFWTLLEIIIMKVRLCLYWRIFASC